jgi:hypothetical protein
MTANVSPLPVCIATNVPALDCRFSQVGWCPDPAVLYGDVRYARSREWTLLMVLVVSGRDATGRLTRHNELVELLAKDMPGRASVSNYRAHCTDGDTAMMLAARYAGWHSTEETLQLLVDHPDAAQVAHQSTNLDLDVLQLAIRCHWPDHVPRDANDIYTSSDTAAMMLLDRASSLALSNKDLLQYAHIGALLAYQAGHGISRTYARVYDAASHEEKNRPPNLLMANHYLQDQVAKLQQRQDERNTLRDALKEGISLPGSTILLYL